MTLPRPRTGIHLGHGDDAARVVGSSRDWSLDQRVVFVRMLDGYATVAGGSGGGDVLVAAL